MGGQGKDVAQFAELRHPGANGTFLRVREQRWMKILFECGEPVYRRLGAAIMILEIEEAHRTPEKQARITRQQGSGKPRGRPPGAKRLAELAELAEIARPKTLDYARSLAIPRPKESSPSRYAPARAKQKQAVAELRQSGRDLAACFADFGWEKKPGG